MRFKLMNFSHLQLNQLRVPELSGTLAQLPDVGHLKMNTFGLTYLDIDDNYIHQIFPLIPDVQATKPEYFGNGLVGAHISVFYAAEDIVCDVFDLNRAHHFSVTGLYSAMIETKKYYVLKVKSPSLIAVRRRYGLSDKLLFKNYWIDLHITVGLVW